MSFPSYSDPPFACPPHGTEETLVKSVMSLWDHGWNTADMARMWGCSQAEVYRALQIGLQRRKAKAG